MAAKRNPRPLQSALALLLFASAAAALSETTQALPEVVRALAARLAGGDAPKR